MKKIVSLIICSFIFTACLPADYEPTYHIYDCGHYLWKGIPMLSVHKYHTTTFQYTNEFAANSQGYAVNKTYAYGEYPIAEYKPPKNCVFLGESKNKLSWEPENES